MTSYMVETGEELLRNLKCGVGREVGMDFWGIEVLTHLKKLVKIFIQIFQDQKISKI